MTETANLLARFKIVFGNWGNVVGSPDEFESQMNRFEELVRDDEREQVSLRESRSENDHFERENDVL